LGLDHELAYSYIAEVETSSIDILSIHCNTFRQNTDDGFEIECKKFLSNVCNICTEDGNIIEFKIWCLMPLSSFSDGRSWSTRREPPTMGKQLVCLITCGCESSAPFVVICS
jgi:hypothetical protein